MTDTDVCKQAHTLKQEGMTHDEVRYELAEHYTGSLAEPSRGWVTGLLRRYERESGNGKAPAASEGHDRGAGNAPTVSHETRADTSASSVQDAQAQGNGVPSTDEKHRAACDFLRTTWESRRLYVSAPTKTRRVCAFGDNHGDTDDDVLEMLIEAQADLYILGGDIHDQAHASTHSPDAPPLAGRDKKAARFDRRHAELMHGRSVFQLLYDNTPGVIRWLIGNHDIREWRLLHSVLRERAPDLIAEFGDVATAVLDALGAGMEDRVQRVGFPITLMNANGTSKRTGMINQFAYQEGDVLVSHMGHHGSQTQHGVQRLYALWVQEWLPRYDCVRPRVYVQFHTHSRSIQWRAGGTVALIEPGMSGDTATTEGYKHSYRRGWRPGAPGILLFTQHCEGGEWFTDFDSIRLKAPREARGG